MRDGAGGHGGPDIGDAVESVEGELVGRGKGGAEEVGLADGREFGRKKRRGWGDVGRGCGGAEKGIGFGGGDGAGGERGFDGGGKGRDRGGEEEAESNKALERRKKVVGKHGAGGWGKRWKR